MKIACENSFPDSKFHVFFRNFTELTFVHMRNLKLLPVAAMACLLLAPWSARADTVISYTGDLRTDATFTSCGTGCTLDATSTDADYAQWAAVVRTFIVAAPSTMEAITFSYGGGTNGSGMTIAQGGFEPYLSLFDAGGIFLTSTFFGTTCPPDANSVGGNCFDVSLDGGTLRPGLYQIAISAFENMSFAENSGTGTLADGFTGLGNLATGEDLHYAFDVILKSPTSAVPEPQSLYLLASAVLGVYGCRKFNKGVDKTS